MQSYRKGAHTVFDMKYHIVWITKYRYHVMVGDVVIRLRTLVREICAAHELGAAYLGAGGLLLHGWCSHRGDDQGVHRRPGQRGRSERLQDKRRGRAEARSGLLSLPPAPGAVSRDSGTRIAGTAARSLSRNPTERQPNRATSTILYIVATIEYPEQRVVVRSGLRAVSRQAPRIWAHGRLGSEQPELLLVGDREDADDDPRVRRDEVELLGGSEEKV